ncbi:MAG TPA: cell division protein ZapA [Candidatus Cryptobacteroides excrementigallinarum]|nr:cell division protein ZapA [Candidatus Cryptobacteroides excrementigallinarum]
MAKQRITLLIGGRPYPMVAESPEMERLLRLAAEDVNEMLMSLNEKFRTTPFEDKLMIVAIREAVAKLLSQGNMQRFEEEAEELEKNLAAYLEVEEK